MKLEKIAANIVIQLIILLPLEISLSLAAPPAVSDVQVVALDNTNVMVNFTTDQEADTRVNFGFDQNLGLFEKSLGLVQNHTITISGLQPDTLYYFKASAENELGELGEGSIIEARTYKTNEILFVNLTKLKEEPIDTVVVEWETSADSDSILYYGNASDNLDRNIPDASEVKKHSITLSGLEKGKRYYYKVKSSYVESEVYDFVAPVDITPPELTYTKPAEFMTDSTLVISGTISENATINIRSGVYPLTEERVLEGEINVSAELYQGLNKIELSATDDHGNYFREYFNVTVDSEAPEIKLIDFTNYAPFEDKNISLKTDEDARITVKLNNESVASTDDYVDNFNHTLKITKDENTLEILAEDAAGNIGRVEEEITKMKELYLEILAPNISDEDIAKKVGNRYKMSVGKTINIVGKTNPGAKVKIWMTYDELRETGNFSPDYEATAGENGIFTIEVEIKDIVTRAEYKKYEEYYKNRGGGDFETFSAEAEYNLEVTYFLRIEAEDEYGRKNKEGPLVLEVTRDKCGSSYPWIVEIEFDEHEFKPYRLQDGHELVEFKIKLDWIGLGENPKITNVIVREQERTPEMFEDTGKSKLTTDFVGGAEQYKCLTEGNIFPRTYKARNFDANRTYWYLLYKLNPWEGLNDTMVSSWSEAFRNLRNKRCMMPLKVVIDYEFTPLDVPLEGEPIAGTERRQQEFCFTQENLIEDKVDPNMVIPEWLLEGSIDFIDSALKALGPIEEGLGLAYDIARGVCLGLLINYAIKKIAVRVKCARATKSGGQNDDEYDPGDA
ncbi:fibronectin type III domain-containing protein, partial [Candidatus Woesearchaeota archaeon]|nr:fibronectin type III domain-containing protein [Candidatus Woesearchaeota archaeon]